MRFFNMSLESFKLEIDHESLLSTDIACTLFIFLHCLSLLS